MVEASWTIRATHEGDVAAPIELPSWSDAVTALAPDLDPFASFVPLPQILDIELNQAGPSLTWEQVSTLGDYDGDLDRFRTILRSCPETGGCGVDSGGKFIARDFLDLSSTSYDFTLSAPLAPGSYRATLDLQDKVGTLSQTLYRSGARTRVRFEVTSVPEPTTTALLAMGLFGVGAVARRRRLN